MSMGDGWAVVAAAIGVGALGILGQITKAFVDDHLAHKRGSDPLAEARKKVLIDMLESGPNWRTIKTLSSVIGADRAEARQLLLQIGARGSELGDGMWGLISRNPFPSN